jgi:hypothetical protein
MVKIDFSSRKTAHFPKNQIKFGQNTKKMTFSAKFGFKTTSEKTTNSLRA